ncbi:MAG: divergent polysaccharide deacetylase family protein [Desulfobacterales bacterium]|jgi:polysaccharide deacetylase 2 family uncharacterized protein YibQ
MNRRQFLASSAAALWGLLSPVSAAAAIMPVLKPASRARIALIIDDIGYSRRRARRFLSLPIPITYAVLPRLALSRPLAEEIYDAGHQVLLHQPMEPVDSRFDPGPGALYVRYDEKRIAEILAENLTEVPHSAGVNNHMGSRFTASAEKMLPALEAVQNRQRFFVDSLTCSNSTGFRTARGLNLPVARRNVFLDNVRSEAAVLAQLQRLAGQAIRRGCAVGIGHPFPETAAAIARFIQPAAAAGIEPVYVSLLLSGPCPVQGAPSSRADSSASL